MTRSLRFGIACVFVVGLAAPIAATAQTFKVDKFDIKGDGGTDYVAVEAATGRVFVSRSTHMMVVDGATGRVVGDIPNTPGVPGAALVTKAGHGFTTNSGDQTVPMFDRKTLTVRGHRSCFARSRTRLSSMRWAMTRSAAPLRAAAGTQSTGSS